MRMLVDHQATRHFILKTGAVHFSQIQGRIFEQCLLCPVVWDVGNWYHWLWCRCGLLLQI